MFTSPSLLVSPGITSFGVNGQGRQPSRVDLLLQTNLSGTTPSSCFVSGDEGGGGTPPPQLHHSLFSGTYYIGGQRYTPTERQAEAIKTLRAQLKHQPNHREEEIDRLISIIENPVGFVSTDDVKMMVRLYAPLRITHQIVDEMDRYEALALDDARDPARLVADALDHTMVFDTIIPDVDPDGSHVELTETEYGLVSRLDSRQLFSDFSARTVAIAKVRGIDSPVKNAKSNTDARNVTLKLIDYFHNVVALSRRNFAQAKKNNSIRYACTGNLAKGGWCVWMINNPERVMTDVPRKLSGEQLRDMLRKANLFEYGSALEKNLDRQDPAIMLQAAVFNCYGDILNKTSGTNPNGDFPPEKGEAIFNLAMNAITRCLDDENFRKTQAQEFWTRVDSVLK